MKLRASGFFATETMEYNVGLEMSIGTGKTFLITRIRLFEWWEIHHTLLEFHSRKGWQFSANFPKFTVFLLGERQLE